MVSSCNAKGWYNQSELTMVSASPRNTPKFDKHRSADLKVLTSGVVDTQLSDHSLVYTILRSSAPRTRSRKICFRSLKNFSRENFVHDMQIVPFHIIDLIDELDDKLYAFEQFSI